MTLERTFRARRLSLTSLIDVIFLLLLFFMLSSTFSRFSEIELASAQGGGAAGGTETVFVQLGPDDLTINGASATLDTAIPVLTQTLKAPKSMVLVSLHADVTAQRLTDLLVALRGVPGISLQVLSS